MTENAESETLDGGPRRMSSVSEHRKVISHFLLMTFGYLWWVPMA